MLGLVQIAVVAAAPVGAGLFIFAIFRLCGRSSSPPRKTGDLERANSLQNGIAKLHKSNYYAVTSKAPFSWADHPSLVTEAVENGWSRFAFAASNVPLPSARSTRSTLLGSCGAGGKQMEVDISWEVWQGSSEFMQKIRLNSGSKKINSGYSVIKTSLPLPGPHLGNNSFPQEAYFEITVLSSKEKDDGLDQFGSRKKNRTEGEKAKLIQEKSKEKKENSESLVHVNNNSNLEDLKLSILEDFNKCESNPLCLGLTRGGGNLPLGLPGTYPGSVGFNSDGSVYDDGTKLVLESGKEWGKSGTIIGCGYNPSQRKIFFTVDSELVHEVNCKSDEFGSPLYPTLAANIDTTVLVNLGQSVFQYAPANAQRTSNPCFLGNSLSIGYEDSKELFSMGRIDSLWHHRSTTRNGINGACNNKRFDFDDESEGDLFEIVLNSSGKSPNTTMLQ